MEPYDVDCISHGDKLVSAGSRNFVGVWNLKTFCLERVISLDGLNIRDVIQRVMYLSHKNSLALGYSGGLCVVSLEEEQEEPKKVPRYRRTNMKAQGFAYLPQSSCFVIRCARYGVHVVNEETLQLSFNYPSMGMTESPIDSQILINENESQLITNSPANRLTGYSNNRYYSIHRLHAMVKKEGVLEVIKDQHKIVVGDKDSGIIYILGRNAEPSSEFQLSGFETDMEKEAIKRDGLAKGSDRSVKRERKEETSKDQLKKRTVRKEEEKKKGKNVKGIRG